MKLIPFARNDITLLGAFDTVVVGGSCGGVAAAELLARRGQRVALVEPRTYLGRELTATLRPWLQRGAILARSALLLRDFLALEGVPVSELESGDELPISLNHLKRFLEDRLLNVNVQLFYASLPVGLTRTADDGQESGAVSGLVIGNKSGRQLLHCHTLIDATATSLLARLAQEEPAPHSNGQRTERSTSSAAPIAVRTLEFDRVAKISSNVLPLPEELGLVDNQLVLHRGYRGQGHLLVECRLRPAAATDGGPLTDLAARRRTTRIAAYLMQNVPQFEGATFAAASHELWFESETPVEIADGAMEHPRVARLWSLNPTLPAPQAVVAARRLANRLMAQRAPRLPLPTSTKNGNSIEDPSDSGPAITIREPAGPQRGKLLPRAYGTPAALPVVRQTEILVVGGGTSGATAAITAAREGVSTALVEMNPGLGGTGTYGGVHSYWFGRRVGFAANVTQMAVNLHQELRQPPPEGAVPRWNIEAKVQALVQAAEEAGVELYLNAIVIGAVVEEAGDQTVVRGVALATRNGPVVLLGRVIIDATGDGDVAARAGAEVVYGAERDHVTMWYSLAQFARPGRTRNNFTSMVDVGNVRDYTRAILAGRRRLRARDHDHGIYVAPRESRHVQGEVVLTLTDQLLQRRWPDVINVAFSNHDVKGHSSSDWVRIGLIPPNLEVEIPYRALLPKGLQNILVVGKALSASHDALPAIRMQADMENLGGAAALAAAHAVQRGCDLRAVDIPAVQERLVKVGVLPASVLERQLQPWRLEAEALQDTIAGLGSQPLYSYSDMDMNEVFHDRLPPVDVCCAGPHAVAPLAEALAGTNEDPPGDQRRLLLARLLALLESPTAVEPIVDYLLDAHSGPLAGDELPTRSSHILYAGAPPDQGAMPDEVYLLHALALVADERALPVWQRVVDLLAGATAEDVESGVKGIFYYVEAVCAGAERLGHAAAIPLLQQLHSYEPFHGLAQFGSGVQQDHFLERRAYLELLIARALARCGSPQGAAILINYLQDARALLAEHAHSELVAISGEDLGKETTPWSHWLEAQGEQLDPAPYQRPGEPRRVWESVAAGEVLVEPDAQRKVTVTEVTNDHAS
jgi:ribulose 1,5-bisphosphate synthetase/thiazole synthase